MSVEIERGEVYVNIYRDAEFGLHSHAVHSASRDPEAIACVRAPWVEGQFDTDASAPMTDDLARAVAAAYEDAAKVVGDVIDSMRGSGQSDLRSAKARVQQAILARAPHREASAPVEVNLGPSEHGQAFKARLRREASEPVLTQAISPIALDGSLSADWIALTLAEDARIEDGRLANEAYLAVKIASASDVILARAKAAELNFDAMRREASAPVQREDGVRVKALRWDRKSTSGQHRARTEIGAYNAFADGTLHYNCVQISFVPGRQWRDTEAAAQADYNARILTSLENHLRDAVAWQWRYKKAGARNWGDWGASNPTLESYTDYLSEKRPLYAALETPPRAAAVAQGEADALRESLALAQYWHESEDKTLSKSGRCDADYHWRRLQHREQIETIQTAMPEAEYEAAFARINARAALATAETQEQADGN